MAFPRVPKAPRAPYGTSAASARSLTILSQLVLPISGAVASIVLSFGGAMPLPARPGLSINTEENALPPLTRGPHGTPRQGVFTVQTTPGGTKPAPEGGAIPRSWLQSPRKWANGRTPTNAGGDGTPNSKRIAAYYGTGEKKTEEQLFGTEEEDGGPAEEKTASTASEKQAASTTPASLAGLVHQTDRHGKPQSQATQLPGQQTAVQGTEKIPVGAMSQGRQDRNPSLWGRFVGSLGLNNNEEATDGTAADTQLSSGTSATHAPAQQHAAPANSPPLRNKAQAQPQSARRRAGLLGPIHEQDAGKKCLVLDLDETLVHSSFQPVDEADFIIPVKIDDTVHKVYVLKRPGVDEYMERMAKDYEIVIFTASLSLYADPLLDELDVNKTVRHRLFRESCTYYQGNYVKDLSKIDRDIDQVIIVDNSPLSFMFQPENAIGCSSFIDDSTDRELDVIGDFLADIKGVEDVRDYCKDWKNWGTKRAGGDMTRSAPGVRAG